MGKVYQHQTKLRVSAPTGIDLENATAWIIYKSPGGTVGTWSASILTPESEGTVYYDIATTSDIFQYGNWKFRASIIDSSGKGALGEPFEEYIYSDEI